MSDPKSPSDVAPANEGDSPRPTQKPTLADEIKAHMSIYHPYQLAEMERTGKAGTRLAGSAECAGVLKALFGVSQLLEADIRFCQPSGVTLVQAADMVVRALETHPERWHESFANSAISVFLAYWPCPKK